MPLGELPEGSEEIFMLNRLKLPACPSRALSTTNMIENPIGTVRIGTRRVVRYRDTDSDHGYQAAPGRGDQRVAAKAKAA